MKLYNKNFRYSKNIQNLNLYKNQYTDIYWSSLYSKEKSEEHNEILKRVRPKKRKRYHKELSVLEQYFQNLQQRIGIISDLDSQLEYEKFVTSIGESLKIEKRDRLVEAFSLINELESNLGGDNAAFWKLALSFTWKYYMQKQKEGQEQKYIIPKIAYNLYYIVVLYIAKKIKAYTSGTLRLKNMYDILELKPDQIFSILNIAFNVKSDIFLKNIKKILQEHNTKVILEDEFYQKLYTDVVQKFFNYILSIAETAKVNVGEKSSKAHNLATELGKSYEEAASVVQYRASSTKSSSDDMSEDDHEREIDEHEEIIWNYLLFTNNQDINQYSKLLKAVLERLYQDKLELKSHGEILTDFIKIAFHDVYDYTVGTSEEAESARGSLLNSVVKINSLPRAFNHSTLAIQHTIAQVKYKNEAIASRMLQQVMKEYRAKNKQTMQKFINRYNEKMIVIANLINNISINTPAASKLKINLKDAIVAYALKIAQEKLLALENIRSRVGKERNKELATKIKIQIKFLVGVINYFLSKDFQKPEGEQRDMAKALEALNHIQDMNDNGILNLIRELSIQTSNIFISYINKISDSELDKNIIVENFEQLGNIKTYSFATNSLRKAIREHYPMINLVFMINIIYKIAAMTGMKVKHFGQNIKELTEMQSYQTDINFSDIITRIAEILIRISENYIITIRVILTWLALTVAEKGFIETIKKENEKFIIHRETIEQEGVLRKVLDISSAWIDSVTEFYNYLLEYFYIVFTDMTGLNNFIKRLNVWMFRNALARPHSAFTSKVWEDYTHVIPRESLLKKIINEDEAEPELLRQLEALPSPELQNIQEQPEQSEQTATNPSEKVKDKKSKKAPKIYIVDPCFFITIGKQLHDYVIKEALNFFNEITLHSQEILEFKSIKEEKTKEQDSPEKQTGRPPVHQSVITNYIGIIGYLSESLGPVAFHHGSSLVYHNLIYGRTVYAIDKVAKNYQPRENQDFYSYFKEKMQNEPTQVM